MIAMNVIGKMNVVSVEDYGYSRKFKFQCVHASDLNVGDSPENKAFTKASPSGEAWMTVDNKYVWDAFRIAGGTGADGDPYRPASQHYVVFIDAGEHSLDDVHRALAALDKSDA
jgi:hypothetical protein